MEILCTSQKKLSSLINLLVEKTFKSNIKMYNYIIREQYRRLMVMSVNKKMNLGLISILFIVLLSLVILLQQFNRIGTQVEETVDSRVVQFQLGSEVQRALATQGMFIRAYLLDPSEFNIDRLNHYNQLLTTEIKGLSKYENSSEFKKLILDLQTANEKIQTAATNAVTTFENGDQKQALSIINNDFSSANSEIFQLTVEIQEYQQAKLDATVTATKGTISLSTILSIVALILSVSIVIILMYYVKKFISSPLKRVTEEAIFIADGDLSREEFVYSSKDEIGQLSVSFNRMKANLQTILNNIQENTGHLSASAQELAASTEEIRATSEDVANRVSNTAEISNITSTAAKESSIATDETSAGIQKISESAQSLLHNTMTMSDNANTGADSLSNAQTQMATIYDSTSNISKLTDKLSNQSKEISQITKVITDLSDQTNLLALNAAIEAARAGEHGKGFAVVADEVRKLAEQSKQSATQIVDLTLEIQKDTGNVEKAVDAGLISVSEGVRIIKEAGSAFANITNAIQAVTSQVEEISAASEEISAGAEQVAASIHQIASGAEKSTSDFEMIAAATEEQSATMAQLTDVSIELSQNAQDLQMIVQKFKI